MSFVLRVFTPFLLLGLMLTAGPCIAADQEAVPESGEEVVQEQSSGENLDENFTEDEDFGEEAAIADPLEPWNRAMFTVNDRLYFWVLKPAAQGYSAVIPEWGRIRVRNVFRNAAAPIRIANCLLQLRLHQAAKEVGRLLVNTIGGAGGMFDLLASNPDAQIADRDFGQTLGKYGIGPGFYLVAPFIGPLSVRDTAGKIGDSFVDPVNYLPRWETTFAVNAYEQLNDTSLRLGQYEEFKESSIDPYTAVKNAYFQNRQSKLKE